MKALNICNQIHYANEDFMLDFLARKLLNLPSKSIGKEPLIKIGLTRLKKKLV